MQWPELWDSSDAGARAWRGLLAPASWLYAAGWEAYRLSYSLGLKRAAEPHRPVLCVGNLRVGGTGKTPATIAIARILLQMGKEVVISCSGYGSPSSSLATLAPEGGLSPKTWGDEAALIRDELPQVPLIVGRKRVRAAEICGREYPKAVLLLDDGFQHLPLKKHLTVLLDPSGSNRSCLPAGPYREPWKNRSRADLVIPGEFNLVYSELEFIDGRSGISVGRPREAHVLCAIGSPQAFVDAVAAAGVVVAGATLLPDHDTMLAGNLLDEVDATLPIIVTAKDWVKLRERNDLDGRRIIVAMRDASIEPGAAFATWLFNRLHGLVA